MATVVIIILLGVILFFFIRPIREKKRDSKYFKWLWWIFEMEAIVYVTGAFLLLLIVSGSTALNHYFFSANRTEQELAQIEVELKNYYQENQEYPLTIKELIRNRPLKRDWLTDNWDIPYRFSLEPKNYEIRSAGLDGIFDTEDDLYITTE